MTEVEKLLETIHEFTELHKTDSAIVIVSPETFAKVAPALKEVKHAKLYSEGKLGRHIIKSDLLAINDTVVTVCKPIEFDDMLRMKAEDYLPVFTDPEVEKLRKHMENAKKKEAYNK